MQIFQDRVAVITGAASGIGRSYADYCAREGMKVVLADIEAGPLEQAAAELRASGATVLPVRTDVSKASDVEALAQKTLEAFGGVHLVFNNAGVATAGLIWELTLADWQWVLGVNLWGVIHGIHTFIPIMLAQGDEGYMVNTASIAGLLASPRLGVYSAAKHAVVSMSETLALDLKSVGARIGVSVVCPWWVKTGIFQSERNRPAELMNPPSQAAPDLGPQAGEILQAIMTGSQAEEIARQVFAAIRQE